MRGSMLGKKTCSGIRRKSTLGTRFRVERKAASVLKAYIEEEEEEEGEKETRKEEDDDDDWSESTSPLYRSSLLDVSAPYLEKRGSYSSWRGEVGRGGREEERRRESSVPRRESFFASCQHQPQEEDSPGDAAELVKIILLGAPAVGKTSIIQQFVWNEFCDTYNPTDCRQTYYPSVVINKKLYDLKISDLPPIPYFPVDSLLEWADFRSYGLRSATAYILVFDLSNAADTFRYIKCLREQMSNSRDMRNVPVVVVGNKHDRLNGTVHGIDSVAGNSNPSGSFMGIHYSSQCPGTPSTSTGLLPVLTQPNQGSSLASGSPSRRSLLIQQQQKAIALAESRERRDIVNIIQKHWRCSYVECSAKYNWRIVAVFKELMQAVDAIDGKDISECSEDGIPLTPGLNDERGRDTVARYHAHRHHGTSIVVESFPSELERTKCNVL